MHHFHILIHTFPALYVVLVDLAALAVLDLYVVSGRFSPEGASSIDH